MPLFGTLAVEEVLASAPTMTSLNPEPWSLTGVEVLQVSYEVDEAAALAVTPPALHPSIPPYATFNALQVPDSPHGAFRLAMIRLIVRAGIRPRALLLGAYCDNAAAAEALAAGWGFRITPADVTFQRRYGSTRSTVVFDGATALDISLEDPEPVAGADLELFDNLHLTHIAGQDAAIVQVDPSYAITSADRGRAELTVFDQAALGIEGIKPVYKVVAVGCTADMELPAPRFVMDPETPAIRGTRRLQPS